MLRTVTSLRQGSGGQVVGQASGVLSLLTYLVESVGFRRPCWMAFLSILFAYGFVGHAELLRLAE